MQLSIIIVNWNAGDYLPKCVQSLIKYIKNIEFEIIVIDNNSDDESLKKAELAFSDITIVRNKENLGFARANNVGVQKARGNYVLLLNPDTEIIDDSIERLHSLFSSSGNIAAAGPVLLNQQKKPTKEQGNRFPTLFSSFIQFFFLSKLGLPGVFLEKNPLKPIKTDWICGACILIKKDIYLSIGGLSEKYFMYAEDMDFCYRLKQEGLSAMVFPSCRVIHYSKKSIEKQADQGIVKLQVKSLISFYSDKNNVYKVVAFKAILFCGYVLRIAIFSVMGLFKKDQHAKKRLGEAKCILRSIYD